MKKRMFSDKFQFTFAVIQGWKTMTSDILPELGPETELVGTNGKGEFEFRIGGNYETVAIKPKFKVGEVVAVAQSYHTLNKMGYLAPEWLDHTCESSAGYDNKMFVRADLMPHQIRIEKVKCELLQEISDEDCIKEGIRRWSDFEDCPKDASDTIKNRFGYYGYWYSYAKPTEAFAELINKIFGKNTWERNPYRIAYEFTLIK